MELIQKLIDNHPFLFTLAITLVVAGGSYFKGLLESLEETLDSISPNINSNDLGSGV